MPLFWTLLPKAGNAKTDERIAILKKLREVFADQPLGSLMDDREFIGVAWMGWLRNAGIFFVLRLHEDQNIFDDTPAPRALSQGAQTLLTGETLILEGARRR